MHILHYYPSRDYSMGLSAKAVGYVADLARIELSEGELAKLAGQLDEIVRFIDILGKADTASVAPTSHILPLHSVARDDTLCAQEVKEHVLRNAPRHDGNYFIVPKVID
jgi:aspartyl-tRNA(Asn)/glutamyl-tRNA(Gln) amidotransferase subunit C